MDRRAVGVLLLTLAFAVWFWPTGGPEGLPPVATPPAAAPLGSAPTVVPVATDALAAAAATNLPAAERTPAPNTPHPARTRALQIHVVGPDGQPLPHAEVLWADEVAMQRAQQGRIKPAEERHFADRLRATGEVARCDARGIVEVAVAGHHLALHCRHGHLSGEDSVALAAAASTHRLVLRATDELVCRATWDHGQPAADVPIVLVWALARTPDREEEPLWDCGTTDAEGRLVVPGWSRMVGQVLGATSSDRPVGHLGPYVLGAGASFVPVPAAGGEILLRVPRHAPLRLRMADATGETLPWSRLRLRLVGDGDPTGFTAPLTDGAAEVLAVAGASAAWRLPARRDAHGAGTFLVPPTGSPAEVVLRCQDVVRVSGRVEPPGAPIHLDVESQVRPRWTSVAPARADGAFELPMSRHDRAREFLVAARGQQAMVVVPPLDRDRVDVGVITLSGGPFAVLDVRDELGEPVRGVTATASTAGATVPCRLAAAEGGYEVHVPGDVAAAEVLVAAPQYAIEQVALRRGERRRITLAATGRFAVPVRLAPGIDAGHVWIHVPQRWSPTREEFVIDGRWVPVQQRDGHGTAMLEGLANQRCRIEVWSLVPPALVGERETALGAEGLELDATQLRSVSVEVAAPVREGADGPSEYVVINLSEWSAERRLGAVRLPFGEARWTVPAAESGVLVAAAGASPVRLAVAGAVAGVPIRLALRSLPTRGVLGIELAQRIVRVGPAVRGGRACRLHAGRNLPDAEPLSFSFLAPRALLPTDYVVEVGGQERLASWRGDRWVLD